MHDPERGQTAHQGRHSSGMWGNSLHHIQCKGPGQTNDESGLRHPQKHYSGTLHRIERICAAQELDTAAEDRQAQQLDVID
eukprot:4939798-Heterocapsa_arctica.AAC.1